jgi:uncharacterized protein (TIGR03435 family)
MLGGPGTSSPERINYSGVPLMQILTRAYGVPTFQVSGPAWLSEEKYEIVANVPPGSTKDDLSLMLQNLLAERFQLKLHHETRERTWYQLLVAKDGLKIKESQNVRRLPDGQVVQKMSTGAVFGASHANDQPRLVATSASMALVANVLQERLGTFVKDETGVTGYYDFTVEFVSGAGDASTQSSAPDLFSALGDLGLKLQKVTGPMDFLVVDSVLRQPTGN